MTTFPGSPRLLKGAIIAMDLPNPVPKVIVFQYNPETLTRSLSARATGGVDEAGMRAKSEALRLGGAPAETITLDVEIDATDQLERGEGMAIGLGVYPQLSALEMLLYPSSASVIAKAVLAALGTTEMSPPMAPLTLFVWGVKRVLPVRLTSFSITEEAYDPNLNPIRAKVKLSLQVLTYDDLQKVNLGYHLYLAHQVTKEMMAAIGSASSLGAVAGGNASLL